MKNFILFSFLVANLTVFSQSNYRQEIKSELMAWDSVRGEWLANSFDAMSKNQPIPNRTFPENLTPTEMYALVPPERQTEITRIATKIPADATPNNNREAAETGQTINRVPVGERNPRQTQSTSSRYQYFVTRPNCELVSGRSYGDPHIKTFDGDSYSFQTVGEYVMSRSPNGMFEVQARQKPSGDKISLNTAVAMNVYGDRVGVYADDIPDNQFGTPLRVNGLPVYLQNEVYFLPHGGTIENDGKVYVITWPTGEKVRTEFSSWSNSKFMHVSVYVYSCEGNYFGLLGNANGRSSDDFNVDNNRSELANSTLFDPFGRRVFNNQTAAVEKQQLAYIAKVYGRQFLVSDQTSLFDYEFGKSSWSFYDPSFPREHLTLNDIAQNDRDRARRTCEERGILAEDMAGCVMDLAHANIEPTPRPTPPNRTSNRGDLNPVRERVPNVNRDDVNVRVPSPSKGKPTRNPEVKKPTSSKTTLENSTINRGVNKKPVTQVEREIDNKPNTSQTSPTPVFERKPIADKPVVEPVRPSSPDKVSSNDKYESPNDTRNPITTPIFKPDNSSTTKSRPSIKTSNIETKPSRTISKPSTVVSTPSSTKTTVKSTTKSAPKTTISTGRR